MDRPARRFPAALVVMRPALLAVSALGCEATAVSDGGGAQPAGSTSTNSTIEGEWAPLDAAPVFAGLEAVPKGIAVRGEWDGSRRFLLIPEEKSGRIETIDIGTSFSLYDVVVSGVHYSFIPGWGVTESAAASAYAALQDFCGPIGRGVPADASWLGRGDSYQAAFSVEGDYDGRLIEVTYEVEQDPATGVLLWERLSRDTASEEAGRERIVMAEVRRELVPVTEVEAPTATEVFEYAADYWDQQVETLRHVPFECVGVDLPGLVLTGLAVNTNIGAEGLVMATLKYSLESWPDALRNHSMLAVVEVTMFPDDPGRDPELTAVLRGLAESGGTESVVFTRGDAVVGIGIYEFPGLSDHASTGLYLSPETVTAALVPVAQLPDKHFAIPISYTPQGVKTAVESDVIP